MIDNRILSLFVLLLLSAQISSAQYFQGKEAERLVEGAEGVKLYDYTDVPAFIRFRESAQFTSDDFPLFAKKVFKLRPEDGLQLIKTETDPLGHEHERYFQTYKGFPVEGTMYIVHKKQDLIYSMNGMMHSLLNVNTNAQFDEAQALQKALAYVGADTYKWELAEEEQYLQGTHQHEAYHEHEHGAAITYYPKAQLVLAPMDGDYYSKNYRLAYKFDIYAHKPVSRQYLYVDAITGDIIHSLNRIHTVDTPGTAETKYSGTQNITADALAGTGNGFRLRESGRGNGIETYDMNLGTNYGNSVDFTDADNYWDNFNAQVDEAAGDAHWGAEMTYDYFFNTFGRNSIDGNGFTLRSYVHYDDDYVNAFWDGQRMTYGDGNNNQNPLTAIDITGHEITHGLTNFTANLVYQNESGALNESFSDIFGTVIENYGVPANFDWLVGEDIGFVIRSMNDPGAYGDPDTYGAGDWYTGTNDNGGVHINSGVQNFWFYLLSVGGSGVNAKGDSYNVSPIGIEDAAAIAFRTLTVYMTPSSQYQDARFLSLQATFDLFGACTPEAFAVGNAWYAVGVGTPYDSTVVSEFSAAPVAGCSVPYEVTFTNNSSNANSFVWDFGDGNTSTAVNPTHTYTSFGSYDVTLGVNGGCGIATETKVAFIDIDPNNPCVAFIPNSGIATTQTACQGTLFDDGGAGNNYSDELDNYITIAPNGAASVTLNFQSFNFESDYDYLYVYDGPNINSPLIGAYTGNTLPNGGTITSNTGAVTIRQYSDLFVTEAGFELNWSCSIPTAPPFVDFNTDDIATCDGVVNFQDLTSNGPLTWNWDFGDGNTSNLQNPTHQYAANGTYTVTLTSANNIGSATETKTAYVTVARPAAPIVTSDSSCGPGEITFSSNMPTTNWYDNNGSFLASGTDYTTPNISTPLTYYAEREVPGATNYVGPQDNSFGNGGYFSPDIRYLIFDVDEECTLKSVWVDAEYGEYRTVQYRDQFGTVIQDTLLYIAQGQRRITLNFNLIPGTNYQLALLGDADLYRNSSNANFPYTIQNVVSITGTNASQGGYYYFFYDWEVQEKSCLSPRIPVEAPIGQATTADFSYSQSQNQVDFTDNSTNATAWVWDFGDGTTTTGANPSHTYMSTGTFLVTLTAIDGGCESTTTQEITVSVLSSIDELLEGESLALYPNPSAGMFTVEAESAEPTDFQVEVLDMMGKEIYRSAIKRDQQASFELSLPNLASGTYFVRIRMGERIFHRKYIRE